MTRLLRSLIAMAAALYAAFSFGAPNSAHVNTLNYATTNVTTSAYVQVVASSPTAVNLIQVCDFSSKIVKIAKGTVGNEFDMMVTPVNGCETFKYLLPAGTRVSIKAVDNNATTGYFTLSFLP